MIVVDSSVLLEVLLRTAAGKALENRLLDAAVTLHAPHLLDLEVVQAVRRYARSGEITELRGRAALQDLSDFPVRRYPHGVLLTRVWALRDNLTAYDASYVALAEALEAPLLTRDRRLASAAGHRAMIEAV